jgi:hypothetical protein
MKKFILSILSAEKGSVSSKRVCGVLFALTIIFIYIYCSTSGKSVPSEIDTLVYGCCILLGVDSVTSIWQKHEKDSSTDS